MRCEDPLKIIEILRLTEQGYSQREIAKSVKCGKSTVGEILTAHFFVATLGDSSYPYVEAFPDEKLDKWPDKIGMLV